MTAALPRARPWPVTLLGYAQLARPANVVTAVADVAAGCAIAGSAGSGALALLALAGMLLYGGGVVLNDAFDAPRDAGERPERPIPAGRATRAGAFVFGALLLLGGIGVAALVGTASALMAMAIALVAALYDAGSKHYALPGALTMATARALNLLLGVSVAPALLLTAWPLALLPFAHVAMLTLVSRGETDGAVGASVIAALAVSLALPPLLIAFAVSPWSAAPFAVLYAALVLPSYWRLARAPSATVVRQSVRNGVLALIALDAALAAGHAGFFYGLALLALWPLAGWLARRFSVS